MMNELFSKLKAYINGNVTEAEFSIWFYDFSRVAEKRFTGDALRFVYDIQAILAEASSGRWEHSGLIAELEMAACGYETKTPLIHPSAQTEREAAV